MFKRPVISLKARAIKYLSSREHSRLELARKLTPYAQEGDDVEAILNWLEESHYLSAERFSESLVHRRASRFGNARILSELQQHGIDDAVVSDIKKELSKNEVTRAVHVLQKKYTHPPEDAQMRAKYGRFLMQRGFSFSAAQAAIKALERLQDDEL